MPRQRISEWLGPGIRNPLELATSRTYNDTVIDSPSTVSNYLYLLGALRSRAPGAWTANNLELTRHMTSSMYLALNTKANQAAAAEMRVMERTYDKKQGDTELSHNEPAVRLLEDPNTDDSWGDIAYSIVQQLGLTGMALLWTPTLDMEYEAPEEMYVLPTASCTPWPPSPVYPHGSYLVQPYYPRLESWGPQLATAA